MSRGNVHTVAKDSIQCSKSLVSLEDDREGVLFKNTSMALFFWGTRIINSPAERFIISSLWCTAHQCKNSFHEVIMSCQTLKPFSSCFILTREAMWLSRRDPKWLVWIQRSRVWRHSEGRLWRGVRKRTLCCFSCILLLNYDLFFLWKCDLTTSLSLGIISWERQPEPAWVKAGMAAFLSVKVKWIF